MAYARFCLRYQHFPLFPASDKTLALFVARQSYTCSKATLVNYMSGVADYQRNVLGMEFQTTMSRPLVNAALKGLRRTQDKPSKKKMAITAAMLKKVQTVVADESFAKAAGHKPSAIRCVFAAILVGFYGMLRKANIASKTARSFDPKRCLLRSDIQQGEQETLMLTCSGFSKTIKGTERVHKLPLVYTREEPSVQFLHMQLMWLNSQVLMGTNSNQHLCTTTERARERRCRTNFWLIPLRSCWSL